MKNITNYIQEHVVGNILWGTVDAVKGQLKDWWKDIKDYSNDTYKHHYGKLNNSVKDGWDRETVDAYERSKTDKDFLVWQTKILSDKTLKERIENIEKNFPEDICKKYKDARAHKNSLLILNVNATYLSDKKNLKEAYDYAKKHIKGDKNDFDSLERAYKNTQQK